MNPLSSDSPVSNVYKSQNTDALKAAALGKTAIANLPSVKMAESEQTLKPQGFNDNFKDLIKPLGMDPSPGEKAGATLTASFIYLSKMGNAITLNTKKLLNDNLKS